MFHTQLYEQFYAMHMLYRVSSIYSIHSRSREARSDSPREIQGMGMEQNRM